MKFEIVTTTLGIPSIKDLDTGEIMHVPLGAVKEFDELYRSPLAFVLDHQENGRAVVFDVGLGGAGNALLTIQMALERQKVSQNLVEMTLVSFEKDLTQARFALENASRLPYFDEESKLALEHLLNHGFWKSNDSKIQWHLRVGDFPKMIVEETWSPDLIFFEPYSPQSNPDMWTLSVFRSLVDLAKKNHRSGFLMTYSCSTSVRAAMLAAGYYVGYGPAVGAKKETTQASLDLSLLEQPLDERWLDRWKKSHIAFPVELEEKEYDDFSRKILGHQQWRDLK